MNIIRRISCESIRAFSVTHSCGASKAVGDITGKNVVFVDGVRSPFVPFATDFKNLSPHHLAEHSLLGLLDRVKLPKEVVEYIIFANVVQETKTTNVARDAALYAGFPHKIPAHTIGQACIGANQAITSAVGLIVMGMADCIACGGVEVLSNLPIRLSKQLRLLYYSWPRAKTLSQKLGLLSSIRPNCFIPDVPDIAEFITNETMGQSADKLAAAFQVSREEQDEYALRSHSLAAQAQEKGYLSDIVPIRVSESGKVLEKDTGIRVTSRAKLAKLRPAFVKPHGTVTAANSSFLTDGSSACLIMPEVKAKELGLKPKAYLRNFVYKAQDPIQRLFLSPVECIASVLHTSNLTLGDIDVWELHEAFAGQLLANLKALDSEHYCTSVINLPNKVGDLDVTKLNNWGGSLSIGHPFAATGIRICTHAANRLIREDGQFAVVSVCAAGGQGIGMLMERHPDATI